MRRLAQWCFNHRVIVLVAWLAAVAGANAIVSGIGTAYTDNFKLPHTQSFDAVSLLQRNVPRASGDTDQIVIAVQSGRVTEAATRARVESVLATVAGQPHVSGVASPYAAAGGRQISPSGQVAFATVTFDVQANKLTMSARCSWSAGSTRSGAGVGTRRRRSPTAWRRPAGRSPRPRRSWCWCSARSCSAASG